MSATLKCRKCKAIVRYEGEDGLGPGPGIRAYRVFDSLGNPLHPSGAFRLIQCLECKHVEAASTFDCEFDDH
jgi:hypothetical protein